MLKIEEGKYYKTRDGRKVGPAHPSPWPSGKWTWAMHEVWLYADDGECGARDDRSYDLIAEWTDGPVVTETVTKNRIVPGVYDSVHVDDGLARKTVSVYLYEQRATPDELDAAAAVLSALAKGLRDA